MKGIFKIFLIGIFLLAGCDRVQVSGEVRISDEPKENYNRVTVDYDSRVRNVTLDGFSVETGQDYYVASGEYKLEYEYEPKISLNISMGYGKKNDISDTFTETSRKKLIFIEKNTEIKVEGKNIGLNIQGEVTR